MRRMGEEIVLPDSEVTIVVVSIAGNKVKLGVTAPESVRVYREEVLQRAARASSAAGAWRPEPIVAAADRNQKCER